MRHLKIVKSIFAAVLMLSLMLVLGCSEISDVTKGLTEKSTSQGPKIIRAAELGSEWQMTQMEIEVDPDNESSIILKLDEGDKVDGYFYLEKGTNVTFKISGNSLVYESKVEDNQASEGIVSDRFSFVSSRAEGATYSLTFGNPAANGGSGQKITVFLEIVYPAEGSVFIQIGAK